ncbi:lactonase family protein [Microbacterium invictum]|uniref:6-phosphogluconolactonase (Cycloisomerase 2 family) n=1 Tax=Microbacterium invictum TaxID=515415 RepID=A0AA40SQQ6_9MICO|nr:MULTISPECIES: beta-propeller fold lactonase family protein [Microbacterium]MBB4140561.1 6-phosphogluconolactonase (cycloisomerase 2 family) [Microbacterium invictum]
MRFLLGGYSADMGGSATGVGMLHAGAVEDVLAGGALAYTGDAVRASSPSWIAWHPTLDVLYAALEGDGTVQAYRRASETRFASLGAAVPAGEGVCHVAVSPDGGSLVASCWGDGRVVRMSVDAAGRPGSPVIAAGVGDPYDVSRPRVPGELPGGRGSTGRRTGGSGAGGRSAGDGSPSDGAGDDDHDGGAGIDLADAARALREAAGDEFAHLVPSYDAVDAEYSWDGTGASGVMLTRDSRDGSLRPVDGPRHPGTPGSGAGAAGDGAATGDASAVLERVSRAHQARFLPGGALVTTDVGLDLVRVWATAGGTLRERGRVVLPRGSAPRHSLWHPSGHLFVVTEASCELFVLAPDAGGTWRIVAGTALSPGFAADDAAAEIALSRDGRYVYAGIRGTDVIATVAVTGSGAQLTPVALVEAGVSWPRHHFVERDTLLVAGQRSDEVASLALDERTGVPGRVRHRTVAPSPTRILPDRR